VRGVEIASCDGGGVRAPDKRKGRRRGEKQGEETGDEATDAREALDGGEARPRPPPGEGGDGERGGGRGRRGGRGTAHAEKGVCRGVWLNLGDALCSC
jgi:hypothetical protein